MRPSAREPRRNSTVAMALPSTSPFASRTTALTSPHPSTRALTDPPGGVLGWIIVTLELLTFSIVFGALAVYRSSSTEEFRAGQAALDANLGLALTLVLITSGALAAIGVHAFRRGEMARTRRWFFAAAASGMAFVVLKAIDYSNHAAMGHGLGSSGFWDAYVLATGFHYAHVLVGVALLTSVAWKIGKSRFEDEETAVAGIALFWHMCDVVWFFLFPLFYTPPAA